MPRSQMAEAVAVAGELDFARGAFRFARPQTEAAYRVWHARQAMPFLRITYVAAIALVYPGALVGTWFTVPDAFRSMALWVLLVLAPLAIAGIAATYREWMVRWMGPTSVLYHGLVGCSFVLLCFYALHRPDIAMTATIMAGFFAFTTLRLHPGEATLAALPYFVLDASLTVRFDRADTPLFGALTLITLGTGLVVSWTFNRTWRDSFRQSRIIEAKQAEIERERERADRLLYNVLPASIADRLKKDPTRIAEHFEQVTVVFGDIAGFTPMSAEMSPQELVAALDDVFTAFDDLVQRHGLEKIKTIGDAYMAVGGVPTPRTNHAQAVAAMALEMRDTVAQRRFPGNRQLRMRIGIHTGPAVAGVIGRNKFIYDLWGDTVNTASRMESHGVPGEIHVTDATRQALGDGWVLDERGVTEIKGKGPMRTWWLKGPAASAGR